MELLCASCRRLLHRNSVHYSHHRLQRATTVTKLLQILSGWPAKRVLCASASLSKVNQPKLKEESELSADLTHPQPRPPGVLPPDHAQAKEDSKLRSHNHAAAASTNAVEDALCEQRQYEEGQGLIEERSKEEEVEGLGRREEQREEGEEELADRELSWRKLPSIYLKLSKSRLTALVVLTSLGGYTMAPGAVDPATLLWAVTGTALCSASANSFNQWMEVAYDSLMTRTKNRVLVRKLISPQHALTFGITTGLAGAAVLWQLVNPVTAALGVANVVLYASIYTPLKRVTIANTWVGSIVGAIPPLMGWSACTGGSLEPGAFVLAGILFAWQFSHFNALSWSLRSDYNRAGYQMMAVTNPDLCRRVALRYSLLTIPICTAAPMFDVTTWWFAIDSLPINCWLSVLAWRFYRDSDFKSSRKLFHFTLFHLPLLMGLMLLNKKTWSHPKKESDR